MRVVLSARGQLRGFHADGHAGTDGPGKNIACAAATSLLRTTGKLCAERSLVTAGAADAPGVMELRLGAAPAADEGWLGGVTDFLLRGLKDLAREFPREISVRTETTEV